MRPVDGQAEVGAGVGREHAGAADVGHDRDGAARRDRLGGQQRGGPDQVAEAGHDDDAGLLEQGSRLTSGVATAAVCEAAARWPAAERPASTASTGMLAVTRRAVLANLRGLPNDSMYSTASLVTPSCSHHISMSLLDTSSLLPTDANEEMPMPSRDS